MSNLNDSPILLLGLKGTGKTHFLVALDWILDRQTDPEGLHHADIADDRAYLQPLREMWLRGEEFERTSRTNPPQPHHLLAKHPATSTRVNFHLPDLAGETFDSYFVTRAFPESFCERLKSAKGILLFVHCDSNADHAILDHPALIKKPKDQSASNQKAPSATDWKLEDAALQTKLVDILQFIGEVRRNRPAIRVAIVISAWELVENAPKSLRALIPGDPQTFLKNKWPLLSQYFSSNQSVFISRVFGVSARGGGNSPEEIERLIQFDNPTQRVIVVDEEHRSSDISRPVRWLLELSHSKG